MRRGRAGRGARVGVAAVVLVAVSLAPGVASGGGWAEFLRVPVEPAVAVLAVALVRGPRSWEARRAPRIARRVVAVVLAVVLVGAVLSGALDRGFRQEVDIDFNPVTGWQELRDGYGVLQDSAGPALAAAALAALVLALVLAVAVVAAALLTLAAALRAGPAPAAPTGAVRRPRRRTLIAPAWLAAWLVLALTGAHLAGAGAGAGTTTPLAAAETAQTLSARTTQIASTLESNAEFAKEAGTDPFQAVPADRLLTALKGKDVVFAFIESYGQVAVQGTPFSKQVDQTLATGQQELDAAGYSSRSGWLTSSTFGGISWLAHATLQTGLWTDSQQRYDTATHSSRLSLTRAFGDAGWRTVSDIPSDTKPWPVGSSFYGYDEQLNASNVGYAGPRFSYARVPDQYTWEHFRTSVLKPGHAPVMAEIDFDSSHTPWTPLPHLVPWDSLGDGSILDPQPSEGLPPRVVWQSPAHVQALYAQSIQYSLQSMYGFLQRVDDPNLVVVVLGDHQPSTTVSGAGANHDVPISIISKDRTVTDAISSWKWDDGIRPSATAPVWRMSAFRDRFLTAFSPSLP